MSSPDGSRGCTHSHEPLYCPPGVDSRPTFTLPPETPGSRAAVFLDRDGVLNADRPDYVRNPDDVEVLPGAADAIARLHDAGLTVVVVTNQQAVDKGIMTLDQAVAVQQRVLALLRTPGRPDPAWYLCPHLAQARCPCRKPAPGMLLRATRDLGLNPGRSVLVGDALTDLGAARLAGATPYLVLTGRGRLQHASATKKDLDGVTVLPDLAQAADAVIRRGQPPTNPVPNPAGDTRCPLPVPHSPSY